jgi:hypothetical protein
MGQCKVMPGGVTMSLCSAACHPSAAAPASSLSLGLGLGLGLPAAAAVVALSLRHRNRNGAAPGAQARAAKAAPEVEMGHPGWRGAASGHALGSLRMGANPGIDVAAGANAL